MEPSKTKRINGKLVLISEAILAISVVADVVQLVLQVLDGKIADLVFSLPVFIPLIFFARNYFYIKRGNEHKLGSNVIKNTQRAGITFIIIFSVLLLLNFLTSQPPEDYIRGVFVLVAVIYLLGKVKSLQLK